MSDLEIVSTRAAREALDKLVDSTRKTANGSMYVLRREAIAALELVTALEAADDLDIYEQGLAFEIQRRATALRDLCAELLTHYQRRHAAEEAK